MYGKYTCLIINSKKHCISAVEIAVDIFTLTFYSVGYLLL